MAAEAATATAAVAVAPTTSKAEDPSGSAEPCKFWLNQGACFKGDRCKYAHSAGRDGQLEWISGKPRAPTCQPASAHWLPVVYRYPATHRFHTRGIRMLFHQTDRP